MDTEPLESIFSVGEIPYIYIESGHIKWTYIYGLLETPDIYQADDVYDIYMV